jgi:hypothetical protein
MQKKTIVLISCAWVLWQTLTDKEFSKTGPLGAFETRQECMDWTFKISRDWPDKGKGYRRTKDNLLYDPNGFVFSYMCLPDTVKPQ